MPGWFAEQLSGRMEEAFWNVLEGKLDVIGKYPVNKGQRSSFHMEGNSIWARFPSGKGTLGKEGNLRSKPTLISK